MTILSHPGLRLKLSDCVDTSSVSSPNGHVYTVGGYTITDYVPRTSATKNGDGSVTLNSPDASIVLNVNGFDTFSSDSVSFAIFGWQSVAYSSGSYEFSLTEPYYVPGQPPASIAGTLAVSSTGGVGFSNSTGGQIIFSGENPQSVVGDDAGAANSAAYVIFRLAGVGKYSNVDLNYGTGYSDPSNYGVFVQLGTSDGGISLIPLGSNISTNSVVAVSNGRLFVNKSLNVVVDKVQLFNSGVVQASQYSTSGTLVSDESYNVDDSGTLRYLPNGGNLTFSSGFSGFFSAPPSLPSFPSMDGPDAVRMYGSGTINANNFTIIFGSRAGSPDGVTINGSSLSLYEQGGYSGQYQNVYLLSGTGNLFHGDYANLYFTAATYAGDTVIGSNNNIYIDGRLLIGDSQNVGVGGVFELGSDCASNGLIQPPGRKQTLFAQSSAALSVASDYDLGGTRSEVEATTLRDSGAMRQLAVPFHRN